MACSVQAQPADSVLAPVEVSAAPYALEPARAPVSIAVRSRSDVERASDPALTADALGRGLPGVWISDRGNAATGERVLVRGLGWRAAFGVRGTHVVLDGIPLTLPDGQTPLNVLDPALITHVELVRGPASTFWGSGSAGVLSLSTASPTSGNRVRVLGGAYGLAKGEASVRLTDPNGHLAVWGSAAPAERLPRPQRCRDLPSWRVADRIRRRRHTGRHWPVGVDATRRGSRRHHRGSVSGGPAPDATHRNRARRPQARRPGRPRRVVPPPARRGPTPHHTQRGHPGTSQPHRPAHHPPRPVDVRTSDGSRRRRRAGVGRGRRS